MTDMAKVSGPTIDAESKVREGLQDALDPDYYERFLDDLLDTWRARTATENAWAVDFKEERDEALARLAQLTEENSALRMRVLTAQGQAADATAELARTTDSLVSADITIDRLTARLAEAEAALRDVLAKDYAPDWDVVGDLGICSEAVMRYYEKGVMAVQEGAATTTEEGS